MQKLIRVFIVYIAIAQTVLLAALLTSRGQNAQYVKKIEGVQNDIQQEIDTIAAHQKEQIALGQKLDKLYSEIADYTDKKVLGDTKEASKSAAPAEGFVTINDKKWQTVSVYETSSYSSRLVGSIAFGTTYRFSEKAGTWYQIVVSSTIKGWVPERFLKEVQDSTSK